ncbi:MAG: hypothetical protein WBL39_15835, partial [Terrimicrobiaceae bacterium]
MDLNNRIRRPFRRGLRASCLASIAAAYLLAPIAEVAGKRAIERTGRQDPYGRINATGEAAEKLRRALDVHFGERKQIETLWGVVPKEPLTIEGSSHGSLRLRPPETVDQNDFDESGRLSIDVGEETRKILIRFPISPTPKQTIRIPADRGPPQWAVQMEPHLFLRMKRGADPTRHAERLRQRQFDR